MVAEESVFTTVVLLSVFTDELSEPVLDLLPEQACNSPAIKAAVINKFIFFHKQLIDL
jgi:hypothetical protein